MNKRNNTGKAERSAVGRSGDVPDSLTEVTDLEVGLSSMIRSAVTHIDNAARALMTLEKRRGNSDIAEDALMELSVVQAWFRALVNPSAEASKAGKHDRP